MFALNILLCGYERNKNRYMRWFGTKTLTSILAFVIKNKRIGKIKNAKVDESCNRVFSPSELIARWVEGSNLNFMAESFYKGSIYPESKKG
jgi:hypothetical protein